MDCRLDCHAVIERSAMEDKIIIYGAGKYGKKLRELFKSWNIKVDYFCQSAVEDKIYYEGIPVIPATELSEICGKKHIMIALADRTVSYEIKKQLMQNKTLENIFVYEWGNFIKENENNLVQIEEGDKYCNICFRRIKKFKAYTPLHKIDKELFEKHHIIGGGYREEAICPYCGSVDRIRWQLWVLEQYPDIFKGECSILHIAPEEEISRKIQHNDLCDYYSGDIDLKMAAHKMDIRELPFRDNFFDYIIVNHVLIYVEEEEKAINELKRVLKRSGKIFLSFPIAADMDTYENAELKTMEERLRAYGQEGQVRLYGKDYKGRLEKYGLKVEAMTPKLQCNDEMINRYGWIRDDVMCICSLP